MIKATQHRIQLVHHHVHDEGATFRILGSRGLVYRVTMHGKNGMHCTCPDNTRHHPEPCKHILYTVIRFFRITRNDLADMLSLRDIDWAFIKANLDASKEAYDDLCPICFDTFDEEQEKRTAHMCSHCTKLTHRACHTQYRAYCRGERSVTIAWSCPFCRSP